HDCRVGSHVVLVNHVLLGGHVAVGDRAFLGGACAVHQFVRIGELAMVGGHAWISGDAPPFGTVVGSRPTRVVGINVVGLRRAGVSAEARLALRGAYRALFRSRLPLLERLASVDGRTPEVVRLLEFVRQSKRGVIGVVHADEEGEDA
ncbi:MAG: acyl-ACP--UDP-N-acetylglucosamine O-acyltransferase, partial [Planctomycetota bacterium]